MISFEHISKSYLLGKGEKVQALSDINLHIPPGTFTAVVGSSGSGKSTLLAIAGLIETPSEGEIYFDLVPVSNMNERERTKIRGERCGFVYQFPSLVPTLNVMENVILPKVLQHSFHAKDIARAKELLDMVGIAEKAEYLPHQLSGGENRRVALVRALMNRPEIIFADEPTGALDEENSMKIVQLFHQLRQKGITIVMVTHQLHLAKGVDQVITLSQGKLDNISTSCL
ncbi:ABC transporter ATP-binding protein [Microaerobacter geothermalis]|uniref:ABC transporter ATP-binding protein n=1 Tax=Microaerobacter geothermalis TaxID=674972 RepID=UPI001F36DF40|nr:ABC transporter ATP-binding protein [Microaerobacter geothermalis]MCF6092688.1 ABC transporter ATP-binding protein [Microaerobacter geothermalis]